MTSSMDHPIPRALRLAWLDLPCAGRADVLVIGGGPAGCAAAIAAGRDGASTILVERFGYLGGMATAGLVPAFCPFSDRQKPIVRGIGLGILEEMRAAMPHLDQTSCDWVPIDPELVKTILDQRVTAAGVRPWFLTQFLDVAPIRDGRVESIVVHNKSGLQRLEAAVIVDCTGDADVCAAAGLPFEKGDPETGELQPCTMCFVLGGVDNRRLQAFLHADDGQNLLLKEVIARARQAGDLEIVEEGANVAYQSETTIGLNFSHVFDVDATNAEQLSKAHVEGRRLVRHLTEFLRKYCPGCENAVVVNTGVQIGVRETRRIVGDYMLTLGDYLARRSFADEVARNSYYIDIHISRRQWEQHVGAPIDWSAQIHQYGVGESHGIPYRCLIPQGAENVLVAGRCISTDRAVQGSTRVMPVCFATGEAAGCAATMAADRHRGVVRAVDIGELRRRLKTHGQYLPPVV